MAPAGVCLRRQSRLFGIVFDFQSLELFCDKEVLKQAQKDNAALEGPSINYALENTVSVSSRSDQQLVRISESKLDAAFVVQEEHRVSRAWRRLQAIPTLGLSIAEYPLSITPEEET